MTSPDARATRRSTCSSSRPRLTRACATGPRTSTRGWSARTSLEFAVAELRERGVSARGKVGDSNPLLAIADALASFPAEEIVIATHPPGQSHWLERGLVAKARARFDVPIAHLVSGYGLVEEASPA